MGTTMGFSHIVVVFLYTTTLLLTGVGYIDPFDGTQQTTIVEINDSNIS